MQLAHTAPLLPHACFLCGSGKGPFVDLQKDDEDTRDAGRAVQYGGVFHYYLCVGCAVDAASIVHEHSNRAVISRAVLDGTRLELSDLHARVAELEVQNEDLRSALGVIRAFTPPEAEIARTEGVESDTDTGPTVPRSRRSQRRGPKPGDALVVVDNGEARVHRVIGEDDETL